MLLNKSKTNNLSFNPFPDLTTARLQLRQLRKSDASEIYSLQSDAVNSKYIDRAIAGSVEDARKFIYKINNGIAGDEWIYWAVNLKNDPKLAGTICLWNFSVEKQQAELGYELLPAYQGKGIMQEALTKVLEYAFETLRLQHIEAYTHTENTRSIVLLEKNGFTRLKTICERHSVTGKGYRTAVYGRGKKKLEIGN